MLHDHDELHHQPDGQPDWQESWYFNWFDGERFGLARIGYRPTRFGWSCDALLMATEHGKPATIFARIAMPVRQRPDPRKGLKFGRFSLQMLEPYKRFRISVGGICDLAWTALAPPHDFGEGEGPPGIAPRHLEQCGAVKGWFKLNGKTTEVNGLGQRDKSWGQRSWSKVAGWEWICVPVDHDLGLHLWTATGIDDKKYGGGFLRRGNRLYAAEEVEPSIQTTPDGRPQHMQVRGKVAGKAFELNGTAQGIFPIAKNGLWLDETAMDFTLELAGENHKCRGLLEHAYHVGHVGYLRRLPTILKTLTVLRP